MIVMVSNNTGWRTHYLQGRYGGLGLLLPPDGMRGPYPHLPWYAIDNGAFSAWKNNRDWDSQTFVRALEWIKDKSLNPQWVVVPDVLGEAQATFERWDEWNGRIRSYGVPVAFAVQDGMTPELVKSRGIDADVLFVGGTTAWKEATLADWCASFPRVHVGRINGMRGLRMCADAGAESCDGTGWFRGRRKQLAELVQYLRENSVPQEEAPMFLPFSDEGQASLFE